MGLIREYIHIFDFPWFNIGMALRIRRIWMKKSCNKQSLMCIYLHKINFDTVEKIHLEQSDQKWHFAAKGSHRLIS